MNESFEIELRGVTPSDVEVFYEQQADPVASAMAAFPSREIEAHRAHWSKILADPSKITRSIVVDGDLVGNIGSWVAESEREIGYWIGREHWSRGVATAALALFLDLVEERPLIAWVAEHNGGSIRVLEKCGFERAEQQPDPEPGGPGFVVFVLPDIRGATGPDTAGISLPPVDEPHR